MKRLFQEHPLVYQFNEIKGYFRKYETPVTRLRLASFRKFAHIISDAGLPVAFDFLGSVNFGLAVPHSDVDVVLYLHCNQCGSKDCEAETCQFQHYIRDHLLQLIAQEISKEDFDIHIVDSLNLGLLENELEEADPDSPALLRFAFYRSICRNVNSPLIRPYERRILEKPELAEKLQTNLWALFDGIIRSSSHNWSIQKYQDRLYESGVQIPDSILKRLQEHLMHTYLFEGDGI